MEKRFRTFNPRGEVMDNQDFDYGYQEGMKEAEKHMVDPDVIGQINDQHIDEIRQVQDDCRKQYEELEAELKTANEPKWIPVSERLPEEKQEVLTHLTFLDYHKKEVPVITQAHLWKGEFYTVAADKLRDDWESDPTHWMPLPAPPKGGNKNGK